MMIEFVFFVLHGDYGVIRVFSSHKLAEEWIFDNEKYRRYPLRIETMPFDSIQPLEKPYWFDNLSLKTPNS